MNLSRIAWILVPAVLIPGVSAASGQHQIVCSGEAAGGYAAFPDLCRLPDGDLSCVFDSGYDHVSTPDARRPKGGRLMAGRSADRIPMSRLTAPRRLDSSRMAR